MPLSDDLIAALRRPPQDVERFLVLSDRLQQEGDPRGELIALQAKRQEAADEAPLRALEAQLIQNHDRALLGKLWKSPSAFSHDWELGFIRRATLRVHEGDPEAPTYSRARQPRRRTGKLVRLTKDLMELESAALLEELDLAVPAREWTETNTVLDALVELVAGPPTLRVLRLRDLQRPYNDDDIPAVDDFRMPDFEAAHRRELTWRGRPLRIETDTFPIDAAADLLGAWEPI